MDEASVTPITLTAPDMPGDAQEAHFQAALAAAQAEVKDIPDTVGLKIQEAANNEAAKAEAKAQVEDAKAAPAKDGEPEKVEPVREDDAKEAPGTRTAARLHPLPKTTATAKKMRPAARVPVVLNII